jgi:hypothetical protein
MQNSSSGSSSKQVQLALSTLLPVHSQLYRLYIRRHKISKKKKFKVAQCCTNFTTSFIFSRKGSWSSILSFVATREIFSVVGFCASAEEYFWFSARRSSHAQCEDISWSEKVRLAIYKHRKLELKSYRPVRINKRQF